MKVRLPHVVTQASTGVTQSAGVASSLTKIIDYKIEPGARVIIDKDTTFMLKDRGTTETADKSLVTITLQKAGQTARSILIASTSYAEVKQNQDTRIKFHPIYDPSLFFPLEPFDHILIHCNSDQTMATANTYFYMQAKEESL